ncbi:hypothetical protein [Burkholderia sp. JP2-270]|uniref:hypothetical protein n=1 Tax=Burkholderia sp. JP2-270 TaxID=2217913 RepID=UPI001EF7B2E7|nr:hypothetical protein [Burkholderia sp. JP2-270]
MLYGHRRVGIDSVEATRSREAGSQAVPREVGAALRARHALRVAPICGGAAGLIEPVHAQVPDAGRAMRDIETPRPDLPPETALELKVTPSEDTAESAPESGPRVFVRAFALDGNTVFGNDKLLPLVADLAGSTPASTRGGVAYSSLRYRLGGAFSDLDSQGRASVQPRTSRSRSCVRTYGRDQVL